MQKYYNISLILYILYAVFVWYDDVGEKVQKYALRRKDNYEKVFKTRSSTHGSCFVAAHHRSLQQ